MTTVLLAALLLAKSDAFAFVDATGKIAVWDSAKGKIGTSVAGREPALSPDGKKIAYWEDLPGPSVNAPIMVYEITTKTKREWVHGNCRTPLWTSDGKWFAYTKFSDSSWRMFLRPASPGPADAKDLGLVEAYRPVWSPIESMFIVNVGIRQVAWVKTDGTARTTPVSAFCPDKGLGVTSSDRFVVSPVSKNKMLFTNEIAADPSLGIEVDLTSAIFLYDFSTHKRTQLTDKKTIASDPVWSRDGRSVYFYCKPAKGKTGLYKMELATKKRTWLTGAAEVGL